MENQINFLSNELADKLVVNSKNRHNSLSIVIPYEYAKKKIRMNWSDILFSIKREYFSKTVAIEYALDMISKDCNDKRILYLACSDESDIYENAFLTYITELSDELPQEIKNQSKNKILYVVLNLLYDNRFNIEDPIHILDIVYDDFDFPIILRETLDNMHCLSIKELNKAQVYDFWFKLIDELQNAQWTVPCVSRRTRGE